MDAFVMGRTLQPFLCDFQTNMTATERARRDSTSSRLHPALRYASLTDESKTFRPRGRLGDRTPTLSARRAEGQNWCPRNPCTRQPWSSPRTIQRRAQHAPNFHLVACSCRRLQFLVCSFSCSKIDSKIK